jgi:hypothetical protein
MDNKMPITKLEGLFDSYVDEGLVTAKEYNANAKMFKEAIEYNGAILKEQQKDIGQLATGNIPDNGLATEQLADGAVTEAKLDANVKSKLLFTEANLAVYFRDALINLYKATPNFRGACFNGSVSDIGHTFKSPTAYESVVTQDVTFIDADSGSTVAAKNKLAPSDYALKAYCDQKHYINAVTSIWTTTYTLEQPMQLDNTALLNFSYTARIPYTSSSASGYYTDHSQTASFKIEIVDTSGKTTNITTHFTSKKTTPANASYAAGLIETWAYTFDKTATYDNVAKVIVTLKYVYKPHDGATAISVPAGVTVGDDGVRYARYAADIYFGAGADVNSGADKEYIGFARTLGDMPCAHLCYKIIGDLPENYLNTDAVKTSLYCSANLVEGIDLCQEKGYASALYIDTEDCPSLEKEITPIPEQTNACLISRKFTAPYCVVFDLLEKGSIADLGMLAPGTYKLSRNPYNDYSFIYDDYNSLIESLSEQCNIANVHIEYYSLSALGVQYKLQSAINNLTLDSLCAVRY